MRSPCARLRYATNNMEAVGVADGEPPCLLAQLPPAVLEDILARLSSPDHSASLSACPVRQACTWLQAAFDRCNTGLCLGGQGGNPAAHDPSLLDLSEEELQALVQQRLSALVLATPCLTSLRLPYNLPWLPWPTLLDICRPALPRLTRLSVWSDRESNTRQCPNFSDSDSDEHWGYVGGDDSNSDDPYNATPYQPRRLSPPRLDLQPLTDAAPSLTHVDLSSCLSLHSLSALSALSSLQHLDIRYCAAVPNLLPLSGLPRLAHLIMVGCHDVDDLTPLSACPTLTYVDMSECNGVTALCTLPAVVSLIARDCDNLEDISALSSSTSLTHLDLHDCCGAPDLAVLSALPSITHLSIGGGCLREMRSQLASLAAPLTALTRLDLDCMGLVRLPELMHNPHLLHLDLRHDGDLTDISTLSHCPQLLTLELSSCSSLADLSGLGCCPKLRTLDLSDCAAITDLRALSPLTALTFLDLTSTPIRDLRPIQPLTKLVELRLGGSTAAGRQNSEQRSLLASLAGHPSLKVLQLRREAVQQGLPHLAKLPALRHLGLLSLAQLGETGVAALGQLSKLETLQLESLCHVDVAPLVSCSALREVGVVLLGSGSIRGLGQVLQALPNLRMRHDDYLEWLT